MACETACVIGYYGKHDWYPLCGLLVPSLTVDQESAAVREQLEKDLHSTRIQLQERFGEKEESTGGEAMSDSQTERINSETEVCIY